MLDALGLGSGGDRPAAAQLCQLHADVPDAAGTRVNQHDVGFMDAGTIEFSQRPLDKAIWGGAVDNLGGDVLGWLTRTTRGGGNIASVGLAAGIKLETTVMPFILRGVSLLGINSTEMSRELKLEIWRRIATDLKPRHLDQIATREVSLEQLPECFPAYIDGRVTGRTLVRLGD